VTATAGGLPDVPHLLFLDGRVYVKPPPQIPCSKASSFLKERSKKLYAPSPSTMPAMAWILALLQDIKVFWFFSSEKNMLPKPNLDAIRPRP
jgi:hypothetical protein